MRFRIRRNHSIHPLAYRDGHNGAAPRPGDEEEWNVRHVTPPDVPQQLEPEREPQMIASTPPAPLFPNGFRSQATAGDARAERLVRSVRMEVADLKHAFDSWNETRDDMLDLDLDAVRENPAAAATLPPAALARALAAAAERIAELEQGIAERDRQTTALQGDLARLSEEHSFARGRMEMLQDVIAALHGNLEDLRYERRRHESLEPPPSRRALGPGGRQFGTGERDDPYGVGGAFK